MIFTTTNLIDHTSSVARAAIMPSEIDVVAHRSSARTQLVATGQSVWWSFDDILVENKRDGMYEHHNSDVATYNLLSHDLDLIKYDQAYKKYFQYDDGNWKNMDIQHVGIDPYHVDSKALQVISMGQNRKRYLRRYDDVIETRLFDPMDNFTVLYAFGDRVLNLVASDDILYDANYVRWDMRETNSSGIVTLATKITPRHIQSLHSTYVNYTNYIGYLTVFDAFGFAKYYDAAADQWAKGPVIPIKHHNRLEQVIFE